MKVNSTNLGSLTTFTFEGEERTTGIFKTPVTTALHLGKQGVHGDVVANLKVHGGVDKACYLFATEQYDYWKTQYPDLNWNWGMFGENLTITGLDEAIMRIGNRYRLGTALIEISQPREPCYKLGYKFKDQTIIKKFIDHGHPGTYARVIEEGVVQIGDEFVLQEESKNTLTIQQFYNFLFERNKDPEMVKLILSNLAVPAYKRARLQKLIA